MYTINLEEAITVFYKTVIENKLSGQKFNAPNLRLSAITHCGKSDLTHDVFNGGWERGWGVSCALRIKIAPELYRGERLWTLESAVSWSSTTHSITTALSAITLYRQVVELAAMLESGWSMVSRADAAQ